jgi:hypothetical protein
MLFVFHCCIWSDLIDHIWNLVQLRSDVHRFFDGQGWVFSPKQGKFVAHFLQISEDLGPLLHNCEADVGGKLSMCIFARFAWALFSITYPRTRYLRGINYIKRNGTTTPIENYEPPPSRPSYEISKFHETLDQYTVDHENELRFGACA